LCLIERVQLRVPVTVDPAGDDTLVISHEIDLPAS
jgi:hypothetical protein